MDDDMQHRFGCVIGQQYPIPVVDHKIALQAARARVLAARKTVGFRDEAAKIYAKLGSRKRRVNRKVTNKGIKTVTKQLSLWDVES